MFIKKIHYFSITGSSQIKQQMRERFNDTACRNVTVLRNAVAAD